MQNKDTVLLSEIYKTQILNENLENIPVDPLILKIDLKRTFKLSMINDLKFIARGREIVNKLFANETLANQLLDEVLENNNPEDTQVSVDFEAGDLFFKFKDDDYKEHQFQVELATDSEGNVVDYNIF